MKRLVSLSLALAIFVSMFSVLTVTAFATEYTEESVNTLYPGVSSTADGVTLSYAKSDQTVPSAVAKKDALGQKAISRSYFDGKKVSEKDNTSFLIDNAYGPVEGKHNINMLQVALNQYGTEKSGVMHYEENEDKSVIKTTVDLKYGSVIDSIVVGCTYGSCYTVGHYKVYAGTDSDTLFDESNFVGEFNSRKIKSATNGYGKTWQSYWSDDLKNQIFTFSNPKTANYIGLKILATGYLPLDAGDQIDPYTGTYPTEYIPTGVAYTANQYVRLLEFNAYGTYSKDIQVDTLNSNLSFDSKVPVSLKVTDFSNNYFADKCQDNLLANPNATIKFTAGNTVLTSGVAGNINNLCDGDTDNGKWGTFMYIYDKWTNYQNTPSGTVTVDFGKKYYFDSLYLMSAWKAPAAIAGYNVYVADSEDDLYNSKNKVMEYSYTGYTVSNDATGKLNTAENNKIAEGQYYTFSSDRAKQPLGRYVGFEITKNCYSTATPAWLYICELGATGVEYQADVDVTNDKLTFDAYYQAQMKVSGIGKDYFTSNSALLNSNLLKKEGVTYQAYKSDGTTAVRLYNQHANSSESIDNITDGSLDVSMSEYGTYLYSYNGFEPGKTPEGYITVSLDDIYIFDDFYLMSCINPNGAIKDYELYIAEDKANLYKPENKVYHFRYDGYTTSSDTNLKLNATTSEGQYVTFVGNTKPTGQYIGIKVLDGGNKFNGEEELGWVYISEMGAHGSYKSGASIDMSVFDTSSFNDEVSIAPDISQRELIFGSPFKLVVNTKNNAKVLAVKANEKTLTCVDGVYIIDSLEENMKIDITTNRDEFATTKNVYNGVDLSKNSSQYDKTLWDGDIIYGESAIIYKERAQTPLMYPIEEIISVRSADLQTVYYLGEDFNIVDGKIVLTKESRIPVFTGGSTYLDVDNGDMFGVIAPYWNTNQWKYQIYVTYKHGNDANGKTVLKPTSHIANCAPLLNKLKNKEHISITFHGDSITCGCNASGLNTKTWRYKDLATPASQLEQYTATQYSKYGAKTMPDWACNTFAEIVTAQLKEMYGYNDISLYNHGIGSTASTWGSKKENMEYLLGQNTDKTAYNYAEVPDLLCIGYGMNENTSTSINGNLKKIIDYARTLNPDCAILLYSAFVPTFSKNTLDQQEKEYYDLLEEYDNLMIVPINSIFKSLSALGKEPLDWTDNGLNHTNDFGVRLYAACILETLNCNTAIYNVTVKDPTGKVITTVPVAEGKTLSATQLAEIRAEITKNASSIYGYEIVYNNGNYDFTDDINGIIVSDKVFTVRYVRDIKNVTVTVKDANGNVIDTVTTLFDKALNLNKYGYTKWVVNGSVIDTSKKTIYVTGDMTVAVAGADEVADSVAIVGNAENGSEMVVFTHTDTDSTKTVKETGVIFVTSSTAQMIEQQNKDWYTLALANSTSNFIKYAKFDDNVSDYMVTYTGAKAGNTYVIKAYVLYTDGSVDYSNNFTFTK